MFNHSGHAIQNVNGSLLVLALDACHNRQLRKDRFRFAIRYRTRENQFAPRSELVNSSDKVLVMFPAWRGGLEEYEIKATSANEIQIARVGFPARNAIAQHNLRAG